MSVKIEMESLLYYEGMRGDTSMLKRKGYFKNYKNTLKNIADIFFQLEVYKNYIIVVNN
jgi:hypothetical protein